MACKMQQLPKTYIVMPADVKLLVTDFAQRIYRENYRSVNVYATFVWSNRCMLAVGVLVGINHTVKTAH